MSTIGRLWRAAFKRSRSGQGGRPQDAPQQETSVLALTLDAPDSSGSPEPSSQERARNDANVPSAFGHYRNIVQLGHGGMGVVYKAEDTRLRRLVALKFLSARFAADRSAIGRFRKEARAASTLNHPNICTVYDVGECAGATFIAMELLEGQSLRRVLSHGAVQPQRLLNIAIQIADGLEAAHSRQIVHRDVKPENVFVLAKDRIKILDFGIAKLLTDGQPSPTPPADPEASTHSHTSQLSERGVQLGTYAYMSPEQVRGEDVDVRSDLFSLGAVLFEMATGRRAFQGKERMDISAAVLTHRPVLPADLESQFRSSLQSILDKALEKKAAFRYQHASDLAADLRRLARDLSEARVAGIVALPPAPVLKRLAGDLVKGAAVAALVLTAHGSVEGRSSGKYLEQFQLSLIQENLRRGKLDEADFEVGGLLLPVIVDVSALHPEKDRPTDRRVLDAIIAELHRHGARAIGVDLNFDGVQLTDYQYLNRWKALKNVRVGIYAQAVERREAWLGRPEFAEIAAGIALPEDDPQTAFSYSRRWFPGQPPTNASVASFGDCGAETPGGYCKVDLLQLPVALWMLSEKQRSLEDGLDRGPEVENRLTKLITSRPARPADGQDAGAVEFGTYVIDYSYLRHLRHETIVLSAGPTANLTKQLEDARTKIADRIVLIGDLKNPVDQFCHTPSMEPLAGVLIHACAVATLNRGMLFEPDPELTPTAAWAVVPLLIAIVGSLRFVHARSRRLRAWPYEHLEILLFVTAAVIVVVVCRWLARTNGVVWPYFLWVSVGFLLYPLAEPLYRAVVAAPAMLRALVSPPGRVGGL